MIRRPPPTLLGGLLDTRSPRAGRRNSGSLTASNSLLGDDGHALREANVEAPQRFRVVSGQQLRHEVLVMMAVTLMNTIASRTHETARNPQNEMTYEFVVKSFVKEHEDLLGCAGIYPEYSGTVNMCSVKQQNCCTS